MNQKALFPGLTLFWFVFCPGCLCALCCCPKSSGWYSECGMLKNGEKALLILIVFYFLILVILFINGLWLLVENQTLLVVYFITVLIILVLLSFVEKR